MLNFDIHFNDLIVGRVYGGIKRSNEESTCVSGLAKPNLSEQLQALGIAEAYPCALLSNIDIEPGFRRKKFGSLALREFEAIAADLGCHFCYCKVGFTSSSETDSSLESEEDGLTISKENDLWSNLRFYMSNGWQPHNHGDFGNRLPDLPDEESWSMAYKAIDSSCTHPALPDGVSIVEHSPRLTLSPKTVQKNSLTPPFQPLSISSRAAALSPKVTGMPASRSGPTTSALRKPPTTVTTISTSVPSSRSAEPPSPTATSSGPASPARTFPSPPAVT